MVVLQPVPLLLGLVQPLPQFFDLPFLIVHYLCQLLYVLLLPHSGILGRLPVPFQLLIFGQLAVGVDLAVGSVLVVCVYVFPWFY